MSGRDYLSFLRCGRGSCSRLDSSRTFVSRVLALRTPADPDAGQLSCGRRAAGRHGTSLDAWLRQHPSVCMASREEVHFFDNGELFRSPPNYPRYHLMFSPRWNVRYGESTPIYVILGRRRTANLGSTTR